MCVKHTATYILVVAMKKNRSKQRGGEASDTVASSSPSGTMVKEEPQEHEDIHDDALDGDFLDREVEQHGANNRSEATDRLVSDTVGNVLELGLQLRLSRDEEAETKAKLENVIQLHDESRQKMKGIAEKEISAASMANAQMVKMILQAQKRYKVLKYLISENKSIRESNVDLKEQLKRANAELAKLSGEKVAADNKVQELSAAVTTLEQHGINLKNQQRLLSYEKAQVEGALNLACDLKVVEENQSENLKKMSELDRMMTVSAARKYELEMRLARARAFLNDTPGVKQEPSNLPKDEGGWQGARCCWAAVKHSRCMSRYEVLKILLNFGSVGYF